MRQGRFSCGRLMAQAASPCRMPDSRRDPWRGVRHWKRRNRALCFVTALERRFAAAMLPHDTAPSGQSRSGMRATVANTPGELI